MNKAGIRTQLKGLLNRNDFTDEQADLFIDQAVARIQRNLRIPPMEKVEVYTAASIGAEILALPNDFLELKHLYTDRDTVRYVDLGSYLKTADAPGNYPTIYTRIQGTYQIKPTPPSGLKVYMVYYGEIPDLINDTDENFLTVIAPDLLIYGALVFAADFFVDERKPDFEATATRIYDELVNQAVNMEFSQDGMAVAVSSSYPEY